jgi:hypothetical protein
MDGKTCIMSIERIDNYIDKRFSKKALYQHGAYLIDGEPYEVIIVSDIKAVVYGDDASQYLGLIDEFRFHAPHITEFVDRENRSIKNFPQNEILKIELDFIQPSQFFIDDEKLEAVSSFIRKPEDIVIQVIAYDDRYIAVDGHTRLYYAYTKGFSYVRAVATEEEAYIFDFVKEANKRGIFKTADLKLLAHIDYEILWNQYCSSYFAAKRE